MQQFKASGPRLDTDGYRVWNALPGDVMDIPLGGTGDLTVKTDAEQDPWWLNAAALVYLAAAICVVGVFLAGIALI